MSCMMKFQSQIKGQFWAAAAAQPNLCVFYHRHRTYDLLPVREIVLDVTVQAGYEEVPEDPAGGEAKAGNAKVFVP